MMNKCEHKTIKGKVCKNKYKTEKKEKIKLCHIHKYKNGLLDENALGADEEFIKSLLEYPYKSFTNLL